MINRNRTIIIALILIIPLLVILALMFYESSQKLILFPSYKYNKEGWWTFYNNSTINYFNFDMQRINMKAMLNEDDSYAGFSIFLSKDYPFLDLSRYTYLNLKIKTEGIKSFGLNIQSFEKGITQLNKETYEPLRYSQIESNISSNKENYSFKLSDFQDPSWWIPMYAPPGKALSKKPLKESILFQLFINEKPDTKNPCQLKVYEIVFETKLDHIWPALIIMTPLYYLSFIGVFWFLLKRKEINHNKAKLLSSYLRINTEKKQPEDTVTLLKYITENYFQPELTLKEVSEKTGIHPKRISEILKANYNMNFRECITWLRIEEAKRLLAETDLNITEIAYKLGFNTNSYFGHIFKNMTKQTPKEYRDKTKT